MSFFLNFFLIFSLFFHCSELLRKACSRRKQTLITHPRIKCFRWKTWQAAGEPRRFALYFFADRAFSYRLNAACPVFLLRTLSGACNENRSIKCCRAVFSTPQAFLSILRISLHKNQNNVCDFIIPPHEKCKNLRGGADSGRGLPLDVFADLHKRIRGFSPAKTAGFLHKNGKRACLRPEAAGAPQIFKVFFPCQNYKITK